VTAAERIAWAIGEEVGGLDVPAMAAHRAFRQAVGDALGLLDEREIVDRVVSMGGLANANNPHAVIVSRLRQLPTLVADGHRLFEEIAEARRWDQVDAAVRRAQTLRDLVEREELFPDEAADMLARELADEDLRSIALAALQGEQP